MGQQQDDPQDPTGSRGAGVLRESAQTDVDPEPLLSRYSSDEIYRPLLVEFAVDLPGNLNEICVAAQAGDDAETCRLSHKLRGAAATYGYPDLAAVAATIELTMLDHEKRGIRVDPAYIGEQIQLMKTLVRRICHGTKQYDSASTLQ